MPTYRVTASDRYRQAVLAISPTDYWAFDELSGTTATDRGSEGDHGTIGGSPTLGTAVGHGGRGITFDGTDDEVTYFTFTGVAASTTTFTVAFWFTPNTSGGSATQGLFWEEASTSGLLFNQSDGIIRLYPNANALTAALSTGVEYHVAVVTTAGASQFYINGVANGTPSGGSDTSWTPTSTSPTGRRYKGILSDIAYWPGTALTAAQIAALYAARSVEMRSETLRIYQPANARGRAEFEVISRDATYRPEIGAELVIYEDSTRLFGGYIEAPYEGGLGGHGVTPIVTRVSAASFEIVAEWRHVTEEIASGTLKAALQTLDNYLPTGFTLHASQANGPTIAALSFENRPLKDCLDQLATITAYVWRINPDKTLRMTDPSGDAVPFNLAAGDGNAIGDVTVEPSQEDYANRIIVRIGDARVQEVTQTETGTGSEDTWVLDYPLVTHRGYVTVNSAYETLGTGGTWDYTAATNSITRTSNVTNGHSIVIVFDAQFPVDIQADDTGEQTLRGIREYLEDAPEVFDATVGQAIADGILVERTAQPRTVRYTTNQTGDIRPGTTQTITLPLRSLTGTWLLSEVELINVRGNLIRRRITAIEGTTFTGIPWRDKLAGWSK